MAAAEGLAAVAFVGSGAATSNALLRLPAQQRESYTACATAISGANAGCCSGPFRHERRIQGLGCATVAVAAAAGFGHRPRSKQQLQQGQRQRNVGGRLLLGRAARSAHLVEPPSEVDLEEVEEDLFLRQRETERRGYVPQWGRLSRSQVGTVDMFDGRQGYGYILYGKFEKFRGENRPRERRRGDDDDDDDDDENRDHSWRGDIKFFAEDIPRDFLMRHGGTVPLGTQIEFKMERSRVGYVARELKFPVVMSFKELGLNDEVCRGAATALGQDPRKVPDAVDLLVPAPVQVEAIPRILEGEDMVIAAETGSGKTLAYMLPMVQKLRELEEERALDYGLAFTSRSPLGLILCPTRELAMQASRVCKLICHQARLRVRLVHGGSLNIKKQRKEINQIVDILVATPDRLLKFYQEGDIKFDELAWVTIDEADWMLTQGFADLQEILVEVSKKSKRKQLRYTLVTASITKPLWKVFELDSRWKDMHVLESRALHKPSAKCSHAMLATRGKDKLDILSSLLRPELTGNVGSRQTLVFCNTIHCCKGVTYKLRDAFEAHAAKTIGCLHKEMKSEDRSQVLRKFTRGELKVLICTDIAQRGIDLPNCGHVINFDFPLNSIDYLHRAGRTARFGQPGKVTSLVKKGNRWLSKAIERSCQLGKPINNLSGDRRDYLRGGSLHNLIARNPHASAAERGLPPPRPYDGSLR